MDSKYNHGQNELRMVMVGKTGNGKSATGNTILGQQCFESKFRAKSLTVDCEHGRAVVDGQKVSVIDTPGLFDTRFGMDKTAKDMCQCISYALPGPHIFLVIIRLGRYTEEEKQTVQKIQEIFGQAADRYSMVLFTGGDQLEDTIEEFLEGSPDLQQLVARCNGQFHVFNNKKKDPSQISELLQKIRSIVQKNGGSHYTNEMFQEAERAIEEEKQRILREKEEQIQRERKEMERKLEEEHQQHLRMIHERLQAEKEAERRRREEERRREQETREWERRREREEREADRQREEEEVARQMEIMRKQLEQQREIQMEMERAILRRQAQQQTVHDDGCTIL